jgi:uncharacterized protein YegJ (DUF2314 family)
MRTHSTELPIAAIPMLLLYAGCGPGEGALGTSVERSGQPAVRYVSDDDPMMAAAIEKARSTADRFIAANAAPTANQADFAVKVPVRDGEHVEHMWMIAVRHENGRLFGTINNEPLDVTTVQLGDQFQIAKNEISDWMYVDDGKLVGGYTLRALRDEMTEEDRREFDAAMPFVIED